MGALQRFPDPSAPLGLCIALGGVYVVATLGLVVFLEVWPLLATYAPALFPALAVVGALNLAMISRQEQREAVVKIEKESVKHNVKLRAEKHLPARQSRCPKQQFWILLLTLHVEIARSNATPGLTP